MRHTVVALGILAAIAVVGVIAHRILEPPNAVLGRSVRDLTDPDDISDDEIRKMVERLFLEKFDFLNSRRLKLVGEQAVPFLIEALADPRTASTWPDRFTSRSPFERVVFVLDSTGPTEAARPLARFMAHEDPHFRRYAARALGNIGTAECIAPMLKALEDDEDKVRSDAMAGIQLGIEAKRCTEGFLDAVFPALARLLDRDTEDFSFHTAAETLLAVDTDRAVPVLLSPEYFTIRNPQAHTIIEALNAAGHKVPHDVLLPFLEAAKPLVAEHSYDYAYAEALLAYGHNPDANTEQILRSELDSPNEVVQACAAEALAVLFGVTNALEVVLDVERRGFNHLSTPQKHYYAVFFYDAEVNNGGHDQYFFNSTGDHLRTTLAGLKAIGADQRAQILQEAQAVFGGAGPDADRIRRYDQLDQLTEEHEDALDALDRRYYACDENIAALLALYSIRHKEHFNAQVGVGQ